MLCRLLHFQCINAPYLLSCIYRSTSHGRILFNILEADVRPKAPWEDFATRDAESLIDRVTYRQGSFGVDKYLW
jgi:hypothetical protein